MVEAERRVHVVDVLQEGEEVLHLLERDALHRGGDGGHLIASSRESDPSWSGSAL